MLVYNFFAIFAAVQLVSSAHAAEDEVVEVVDCTDLKKFCNCSVGATVCKFELRISRILPMTSYKLGPDGQLLADSIGAPYTLNSTAGFRSVLRGTMDRPCVFGDEVSLLDDDDFIGRGCSPPLTLNGISTRNTIVINGITPGPTLVVDSGATVMLRVYNGQSLGEDTSMHWHGMYQRHTAWMDGVGGITEPSIESGTSFDYIFKAKPKGTHWYHSHVGLQRVNGMFAAMVVRGPTLNSSELIPEDGDANITDEPEKYTFTLVDWAEMSAIDDFLTARRLGFRPNRIPSQFLTLQGTIADLVRSVRADGSDNGPVPFFSGLINGRGRFQNTITPLSEFSILGGTYVLFRVVGAIETNVQKVSIDGHTLRVIACDGKDIEPVDVDVINVEAGERFDFIVNASAVIGNYWIRAETQEVNTPNGEEHSARAILSYDRAPSLDWRNGYTNVPEARRECTAASPCIILNCPYESVPGENCVSLLDLVPRPKKSLADLPRFPPNPDCPDCMHFLDFGFQGPGPHSVNARTLELPTTAYQTNCGQYDEDNSPNSTANTCDRNCPEGGSCKCIHVIPVANQRVYKDDAVNDELESIVVVFSALTSGSTHPIHMHGHAFQVVYIGYGTFDSNSALVPTTDLVCDDPYCTNTRWANGVPPEGALNRTVGEKVTPNAIQKDTVVVPAGGYVVVAIKADNPGYWYIHCHIEGHTHGGMVVIMQEYPPIQQWLPPPGIEDPENGFTWTVDEFNTHVDAALTCAADVPATLVPRTTTDADEITISRAGFGVTLAILILLAILCLVLLILLIVVCIVSKKKPEKGFDKVELSPK